MSRSLHLIDLENVVGHGCMTTEDAQCAWARLDAQLAICPGDHVVVATGRGSAANAAFVVMPHRFRIGRGHDGADLQLLEVLDSEHVAERYDRVVLVSGDGIFTEAIAKLAVAGVHVVVASEGDRLAKRLRLAAREVVVLTSEMDVAA